MGAEYHVSKQGRDTNRGTSEEPFLTIQKAAQVMAAGDRVIVHEGEYREWVRPQNGGLHDGCRIIYEAAQGERVVIKGSETLSSWERVEGTVWKAAVENTLFGEYNPYEIAIEGDWLISPHEYTVHVGEVYLNGKSLYEAKCMEDVFAPGKRLVSEHETWGNFEEALLEPEWSVFQWRAEVDDRYTTIFVNFQHVDPNKELVEINVRPACFFPERVGLNYITVRGFEMAHAATMWAPPTACQTGLLGPNWSKGWVIENNFIHDSKCSGISLGKEASTGDNDFTRFGRKPGYQYQMEAVFKAKLQGWSREKTGSHIVRNNVICDCGQAGIVGHMGCAFSEVYGNEIYNISVKREFYGHELGGIKFHAAIDTYIHHNYLHNCSLGMWLDWQAQGVRVSCNIFDKNNRDFMIEVTHGPYLVDNNIFTAEFALVNAAQGGAYLHNLCAGFISQYKVTDRATPYHLPHSTELLGTAVVYGGDDRWMNNIFVGGRLENMYYGTALYNGSPSSMEEYIELVRGMGWGDVEQYAANRQPVYIEGNVYMSGAKGFDGENDALYCEEDPCLSIETEGEEVYLNITLPEAAALKRSAVLSSHMFPQARIPEQRYENPNGEEIRFDRDLCGGMRGENATAGPVDSLRVGRNRVRIWKKEKLFQ